MPNEIDAVVASLRSTQGNEEEFAQAYAVVDRLNAEGRTAELLALSAAVEAACDVEGDARLPYEAVADHVEEALALTPGADHVAALLTLLGRPRVRSVQRPRSVEQRARAFASRLAHGQPKETLLEALARGGGASSAESREIAEEVRACWLHEAVLRGVALEREPGAAALQADLAAKGHPLGALPLRLLESETEAPTYMPMYGVNAIAKAVQRLASGPLSTKTMPPPGEHTEPRPSRVEAPADESRLREAVAPWLTAGSLGKAEAKVFRLDPALTLGAPGRWLLRLLALECVEGAPELRAERCTADAVWGALFAAAANGGACSSGLGGAYGRRAAWSSLGALVGAPADAAPVTVDRLAESATFLMFGADPGGWWHEVAWDLGALALRAGGGSVAVLAATDAE